MTQATIPTTSVEELHLLEAELIERQLARRRLKHFVARFTDGFIPGWHVDEIASQCELAEQMIQRKKGTDARFIIEAPPRHTKSQTISKCFPLWYLAQHPNHEVIVATYNQELADDIGRWAKRIIDDPAFQAVFPDFKIRKDSKAANRLETPEGGGIRYVGVGGSLTGRGGHLIIVDDPIKGAEDADSEAMSTALWSWYTSVLRTRLAPGGAIMVLHTRWRVNDLIGRLLQNAEEGGEQWHRITLPAENDGDEVNEWGMKPGEVLHPNRFNPEDIAAIRRSLPPRDWLAMYMQRPMPDQGNIFAVDDFDLYEPGSAPSPIYWYLSTDLAASTKTTADYSVIWPVGIDKEGKMWFAPDFVRARLNTSESIDAILKLAKQYAVQGILMEGGPIWSAIQPELMRRMRLNGAFYQILECRPMKDKVTRSRPLHARMQAGMVKWPNTRRFTQIAMPEFLVFSGQNDDHDDLVDTAAWPAYIADRLLTPHSDYMPSASYTDEDEDEDENQGKVGWNGRRRKKGKAHRYC